MINYSSYLVILYLVTTFMMAAGCTDARSCNGKEFALVRWLEDETVGVMPLSSVKKGYNPFAGATVKMKWRGKREYEAEILKISRDRHNLSKLCDKLVNMDITIEDILDEECNLVDSTTTGSQSVAGQTAGVSSSSSSSIIRISAPPVKKAKMAGQTSTDTAGTSSSVMASVSIPPAKKAKKAGTKSRKKTENPTSMTDGTMGQKTKPPVSEKKQNALAKVAAAKERANMMFSAIPQPRLPSISSSDDELTDHETSEKSDLSKKSAASNGQPLKDQLETQRLLIKSLQQQLKSHKSMTLMTNRTPMSVDYGSTLQPEFREGTSSEFDYVGESGYNSSFSETSFTHATDNAEARTSTPIRKKSMQKATNYLEKHNKETTQNNTVKVEPTMVELVPGYGVKCTQRQIDEVEASCSGSSTKMIRKFMSVFFTEEVLAKSSCYGSRGNDQLDADIVAACMKYVQSKHTTVARAVLVEAINDKCAQTRRKFK